MATETPAQGRRRRFYEGRSVVTIALTVTLAILIPVLVVLGILAATADGDDEPQASETIGGAYYSDDSPEEE